MAIAPWLAGQRITAARLNNMLAQYSSAWTPTWTTSTGSATPSFGNATITTEYGLVGNLCVGRFEIAFGSTTTYGTAPTTGDNWRFSTPVTAAGTSLIAGWGEIQDTSVGLPSRMGIRLRLTTTTTFELEMASGRLDAGAVSGAGLVDSLSPWTWANGDTIRAMFMYQTAAT